MPELGDDGGHSSMDLADSNDTFQQEIIVDVVPIDIESTIRCHRDNIEDKVLLGVASADETMVENNNDEEDGEHEISDGDIDADIDYDMFF